MTEMETVETHGRASLGEALDALEKEHGRRRIKKAVKELFARWGVPEKTGKEKEYERIAADIYEKYPGDGSRALTIRNVVGLLKAGVDPGDLYLAADRYRAKLKAESKAGKDVRFEYIYHSHNFFGKKEYWLDFVERKQEG